MRRAFKHRILAGGKSTPAETMPLLDSASDAAEAGRFEYGR